MSEKLRLLTGATGFLGRKILSAMVARSDHRPIGVLIRGRQSAPAPKRFTNLLHQTARESGTSFALIRKRVRLIEGDLGHTGLRLMPNGRANLSKHLGEIIHCGANVRFDANLATARQANLEGTRNLLDLAQEAADHGKFSCFYHVSTAYVAGDRTGVVHEADLDHNQHFNNAYEQSKFETEQMLRANRKRLPIAVVRPSIVVGDSQTGATDSFQGFYALLNVIFRGEMRIAPGGPKCHLDIVPVDYVAQTILQLADLDSATVGRTFHVTSGAERNMPMQQMIGAAEDYFDHLRSKHGLPLIAQRTAYLPAEEYRAFVEQKMRRRSGPERLLATRSLRLHTQMYGYARTKNFTSDQIAHLLGDAWRPPPLLNDYLHRICNYCVDSGEFYSP